jgi:hypothetical protein
MWEQVQAYPQAAHCYEEVLLHSPQSIPLYVRFADVLYTMGGSNLKTARQYYAAALKLSEGEDTRALYGICCTAAALSAQKVWRLIISQRCCTMSRHSLPAVVAPQNILYVWHLLHGACPLCPRCAAACLQRK